MHVLFASHSAQLFGAERSLLALVREAALRGHRVTVVTPEDGPLCGELRGAGAEVVVLPTRLWMGRRFNLAVGSVRLLQAAASVPRYRRFVARVRPGVVVTNSAVVPAASFAARLTGLPHVWVVRESLLTNPSLRSALPRRTVARAIARLADGVVAISAFVAGQVLDAAPAAAGKLRVIAPPVTPQLDDRPAPPRPDTAGGLTRVALLGRYSAEKGQDAALEAAAACLREGQRLHLRLVGVGDEPAQRALRDRAAALGIADLVEIVPWTDDARSVYEWAGATLMLSGNEAFGRVSVESLQCGTPVVGFRAGATTEILAEGGGVLVEPDAPALAKALLELARHPDVYADLKRGAQRRAQQLAAAPSSAVTFVDYLEQLHDKHQ
jgi:glycosyltransferase involved in cell wall biosynthesis